MKKKLISLAMLVTVFAMQVVGVSAASKTRVIVMTDAAHAFGAEWNGKAVGSIADFSNFSFHAVKNFTTEAELLDAADDVDKVYVEKVLPEKMKYNLESIRKFGFWREIGTMVKTVVAVVR